MQSPNPTGPADGPNDSEILFSDSGFQNPRFPLNRSAPPQAPPGAPPRLLGARIAPDFKTIVQSAQNDLDRSVGHFPDATNPKIIVVAFVSALAASRSPQGRQHKKFFFSRKFVATPPENDQPQNPTHLFEAKRVSSQKII